MPCLLPKAKKVGISNLFVSVVFIFVGLKLSIHDSEIPTFLLLSAYLFVLGNWNFPCILLSAPNLSDSLFESICLNCGGKILCWEKWSGPVQARTTCTGVPFVVAKFSTRGIIIKPAQGLCYEYCCYITICMLFCNFIDDTVGERKLCLKYL
jgi:hypothetical protein